MDPVAVGGPAPPDPPLNPPLLPAPTSRRSTAKYSKYSLFRFVPS